MLSFGHRRALADRWASRGGGRIINAPRLPKLHLSGFPLMATAEHTALRSACAKKTLCAAGRVETFLGSKLFDQWLPLKRRRNSPSGRGTKTRGLTYDQKPRF